MRRRDLSLRAAGLILTGVVAVHELRYLLAPAPEAGHGYLPLLGVVSVVVLAAAAGQLAGVLEDARRTGREERVTVRFAAAWPLLAMAIVLLFGVQEAAEGLLSGAGAAGLTGLFASGGWLVLPLSVALSALLALALTGAGAAVAAAARTARFALRRRRPSSRRLPGAAPRPTVRPLPLNLAGRAPPVPA